MKIMITIFLMAIALAVLAEDKKDPCEHYRTVFRCVKYVKNYDADTVTFDIPNTHPLIGESIAVRVLGLDTPEIKGGTTCEKKKAIEAKDFVSKLMKDAKKIDLENVQKDKYFRILADVKIDGKSLTQELLDKGYAYPYDGGTKIKVDWCKDRLPAGEIKK